MIIKFELNDTETDEKEKAERIIRCDDAFSLLWDIDNYCRGILKYSESEVSDKHFEEIREKIYESKLLELYQ